MIGIPPIFLSYTLKKLYFQGIFMSSYRRFISYMYTYKNGQKESNCGFIKVEIRDERCIISFQLKNIYFSDSCHVYLYCPGHDPLYLLLQDIPINNQTMNYCLETSSVHMTSEDISFDKCAGLLCTDEQGNDYGTCWGGGGLPEFLKPAAKINFAEEAFPEAKSTQEKEPISEDSPATPSEPVTSSSPRTFTEQWAYMLETFPHFDPFEDKGIFEVIKIAPADLGYLQSFQLNLGNNQFMLHGYETYHHLILGRVHGQMRYILGVPGIYDQQEQFMAKMFGFPCFKPTLESRQKKGQFGYWIRCFKEKRD